MIDWFILARPLAALTFQPARFDWHCSLVVHTRWATIFEYADQHQELRRVEMEISEKEATLLFRIHKCHTHSRVGRCSLRWAERIFNIRCRKELSFERLVRDGEIPAHSCLRAAVFFFLFAWRGIHSHLMHSARTENYSGNSRKEILHLECDVVGVGGPISLDSLDLPGSNPQQLTENGELKEKISLKELIRSECLRSKCAM